MLIHRAPRARPARILSVALPLSLALSSACADEPSTLDEASEAPGEDALESDAVLHAEASGASTLPNLARGTREVLVENIVSAENSLFTASGKLLISGDQGIFELRRDASGRVSSNNLRPGEPCKFGGMAQLGDTVYANCYADKSAALYAAPEATLAFAKIADIAGATLVNGLAADPAARALYVTATTEGKLLKLTVSASDPRKIDKQEVVRSGLLLPNGLDIHGGYLYWGEYSLTGTIRRVPLDRVRSAPTVLVKQAVSFLDDFHVDDGGLLVADFLLDTLRAYDARGRKLSQTAGSWHGPSSVIPARGRLGLGANDLIVTEKMANLVSVFRSRE